MQLFERIKKYFNEFKNKKRILVVSFLSDGILFQRFVYSSLRSLLVFKGSFIISEVSEKDFADNKRVKLAFWKTFFPFYYKIIVVASHNYCQSKYFKMSSLRPHPKEKISIPELNNFFSNNLCSCLENHKNEIAKEMDFDDTEVLLVNNRVIDARVSTNTFIDNYEGIFESSGKNIEVGVIQTFVFRPIFASLSKIIPARARIWLFSESNFNLPLSLYIKSLHQKNTGGSKKFILASIKEKETEIFIYDGKLLKFLDIFNFGFRNIYVALNNVLGIELNSFFGIMDKISRGLISPQTEALIWEIINKELNNFYNGISAFKKNLSIPNVCIDAGKIYQVLKKHKKFAPLLLEDENISHPKIEGQSGWHGASDVLIALSQSRKDTLNALAIKMIRWLIPHNINSGL